MRHKAFRLFICLTLSTPKWVYFQFPGLIPQGLIRTDMGQDLSSVHLPLRCWSLLLSQVPAKATWQQVEKHSLPHASHVVSGSHSVCSLSFLSPEVGGAFPQTCYGPSATSLWAAAAVRALLGTKWEKGFVGVLAYSVGVTFYLIIHFCAWTSESPG